MAHLSPIILSASVVALVSCTVESEEPEPASGSDCPRFEELRATATAEPPQAPAACVAVEVVDLEERELDVDIGGFLLRGTLTLPVTRGDYRAPAAVLVHGSGQNSRAESQEGNLLINYGTAVKTFELLADALVRRGFVVYRYDKRYCFRENSGGVCENSLDDYPFDLDALVIDDVVDDALRVISDVAVQPEVRPGDVMVFGHSEGGQFVPRLLDRASEASAGVMLAGPTVPADQAIVRQLRVAADFLENHGQPSAAEQLRADADEQESAFAEIRAGTFAQDRYQNVPLVYWNSWFALGDAFADELARETKPILATSGTSDFNVDPFHLERFDEIASAAGSEHHTSALIEDMTHALVTVDIATNTADLALSTALLDALDAFVAGLADGATMAE